MKILITCFDPFGKDEINTSKEVLDALDVTKFNANIIKLEIPTIRYKALDMIIKTINKEHPDVIVSLGQAGGRDGITIERIGINLDDFRIKDNDGNMPIDEPIYYDGPAAYFSTLPIREIVDNLNQNNIKASISNSAGTFVCNHVLYGTRYYLEHNYPDIKCGFIHVPYINGQGTPSLEKEEIVKGISLALETIINH